MTDTGDVRDCNRDVPCNEFGPCIVHDPAPEGILDKPKPAPEGEARNSSPDMKETCGHGFQLCWSSECRKPVNWDERMRRRHKWVESALEQMRKERDVANGNAFHLERKHNRVAEERDNLQREVDDGDAEFKALELNHIRLVEAHNELQREVEELREALENQMCVCPADDGTDCDRCKALARAGEICPKESK